VRESTKESLEDSKDIIRAEMLVYLGSGLDGHGNLSVMANKLEGMISCSRPQVDLG
jgi:electron transfer flavoprotein alpha subunit